MPAFLFPKNRQATGMSRTLCQGAPKPPATAAPSVVTWSRAKVGPQTVPGVLWSSRQRGEGNPVGALAPGPHAPAGMCTPALRFTAWERGQGRGWGSLAPGGLLHGSPHLFQLPLKKASCPKERNPTLVAALSLMSGEGQERWDGWGPRQGLRAPSLSRPLGVGVLSPAAGEVRPTHPRQAEVRASGPTLLCTEPQFPWTHGGTGRRPMTTFFLPGKVQNNLGAGSGCGRRPRAAGAVRVALFTREAEEARPAGRWRRRGRGRPGGAAAAAPARLLLQAGRRGARPRPGCGPGVGAAGGRSGWGATPGAGPGGGRPRGGWGGRYLLFGALRTRPAAFVFFLAKSPSKGSTEA